MGDYISFIENAWKRFINTGEVDLSVRKDIRNSWIRCKSYGVDYNSGCGSVKHDNIKYLIEKIVSLFLYLSLLWKVYIVWFQAQGLQLC
ncbi:hypothetical protein [Paraclostridium sp. AKS73]|uniref:hypothetical protein n=1 Tax=Paraclostridium sp. AKS73 TaxID=2876116 RepID=UPI002FCD652B